ncbi:MAG: diadenylate cyclase CdaA [Thermoanaerobaculia bacterium]
MPNWYEPFLNFGFLDLLDILLVSFLIYNFFLLIKGTRIVNMIVGLLIFIGIYYLANYLDLKTLKTLLKQIFFYLPIILILLFQNEIRRLITKFVKNPFRWGYQKPEEHLIREIVLAVTSLSSRRHGALIVFERNEGLRDYVETGIPINATVSAELLSTIFIPDSPIHDGAVIIQGDTIACAGTFLPLSLNPLLAKDYGTRHRAAIGITEETDAISVVVSEETGVISFAVNGHIQRFLDSKSLEGLLVEYIVAKRKK